MESAISSLLRAKSGLICSGILPEQCGIDMTNGSLTTHLLAGYKMLVERSRIEAGVLGIGYWVLVCAPVLNRRFLVVPQPTQSPYSILLSIFFP